MDANYTSESLEVRTHQTNKIFRQLYGWQRVLLVAQHVQTDVVFENFRHKAVYPAAYVRQEYQHVRAIVVCCQRTFDGVNLPADPLNASNELLFFFFEMRHFFLDHILGGYGIRFEFAFLGLNEEL